MTDQNIQDCIQACLDCTDACETCVDCCIGDTGMTDSMCPDHVPRFPLGSGLVRILRENLRSLRDGVHHGHNGMRRLAERLCREVPNMRIGYKAKVIEGEIGFLEWTADCDNARIEDGADSYVIRNGFIVAQTIHYTILKKNRGCMEKVQRC